MIRIFFGLIGRTVRKIVLPVTFLVLGVVLTVGIVAFLYLRNAPVSQVWHSTHLSEEFTADTDLGSFADYLALEDRLFQELQDKVYDAVDATTLDVLNRYHAGSKTDPTALPKNWNRSFELPQETASVGVVMLHGLSDSPYSMRALGTALHNEGAHVIGLRVPGHGTAPSGLVHTRFDDMAAAVALVMQDLARRLDGQKIFVVGYSNGGALAVHYATRAVSDPDLPKPDGVVLMSPEIGVSPLAAYAEALAWVGETFGLAKLSWNGFELEYDPYKYNSFPTRADVTAYDATKAVKTELDALFASGNIAGMPPVLAFQSAADATVVASDLVEVLFDRLAQSTHELVLFDVNRVHDAEGLLVPKLDTAALLQGPKRAYTVSVVTNTAPTSYETVLQSRPAGSADVETRDLALSWPDDVYSLAHIALPFERADPLYGRPDEANGPTDGLQFGGLPLFGERSTTVFSTSALTRQHWNPFFPLVSSKAINFMFE